MEIVIPLLLMVVFYLVPELLRRRRPQDYQYPKIPEQTPPGQIKMHQEKLVYQEPLPVKKTTSQHSVTPAVVKDPTDGQEQPAWQGKIDNSMLVNGVIFSEILRPPRAYRPMIGQNAVNEKNKGK
ncbi:MAG TPA: hypothetical protein VGL27_05795 [Negativicutes bacterium]|jgi:hypothetical protein